MMTRISLLALLILLIGCEPLVEKFQKQKEPTVISLDVRYAKHPRQPGYLIAVKAQVSRNTKDMSVQITQKISGQWYDKGSLSKIYNLEDTKLEPGQNAITVVDVIHSTKPGTFRIDIMAMRGNRWDRKSKTITIKQLRLKAS